MSKSYKYTPIYKDHVKGAKREANRRVRRLNDLPSGGAYKKYYDQYNISDYKFQYTLLEYLDMYTNIKYYISGQPELTPEEKEQYTQQWRKYYLNK